MNHLPMEQITLGRVPKRGLRDLGTLTEKIHTRINSYRMGAGARKSIIFYELDRGHRIFLRTYLSRELIKSPAPLNAASEITRRGGPLTDTSLTFRQIDVVINKGKGYFLSLIPTPESAQRLLQEREQALGALGLKASLDFSLDMPLAFANNPKEPRAIYSLEAAAEDFTSELEVRPLGLMFGPTQPLAAINGDSHTK